MNCEEFEVSLVAIQYTVLVQILSVVVCVNELKLHSEKVVTDR